MTNLAIQSKKKEEEEEKDEDQVENKEE